MPGMYVVTSIPFVRRTRAIFRSAEFGFFGVVVFDLRADAPALRAGLKRGRLRLVTDGFAPFSHELADRRHETFVAPSDVERR